MAARIQTPLMDHRHNDLVAYWTLIYNVHLLHVL